MLCTIQMTSKITDKEATENQCNTQVVNNNNSASEKKTEQVSLVTTPSEKKKIIKKTKLEQKHIDEIEKFMDEIVNITTNIGDKKKYFQSNLPDYGKSRNAEIRLYLCRRDPLYMQLIDEIHINPAFLLDILDEYRHTTWNRRFITFVPLQIVRTNEKVFLKMINYMLECEVLLDQSVPIDNKKIIAAFCENYGNSFAWLEMASDRVHEDIFFVKEMLFLEIQRHGFFHPYFYNVVRSSKKYKDEVIGWWEDSMKRAFPKDYDRMIKENSNLSIVSKEELTKQQEEANKVVAEAMKDKKIQSRLKEFGELKEKVDKKFEDTKKEIYDDFINAKPKVVEVEDEDGNKVNVLKIPNYHDKIMEAITKEYKIGTMAIRKRMIEVINAEVEYGTDDKIVMMGLNSDGKEEIIVQETKEESLIVNKMENMKIIDDDASIIATEPK